MSITIEFLKNESGVAEYSVAINGFSPTKCGLGSVGRAKALSVLEFATLEDEIRAAIEEGLQRLEEEAEHKAAMLLQTSGGEFSITVTRDSEVEEPEDIWDYTHRVVKVSSGP
ncbi:hypothetical protein [Agrobacterium sp. V1]|uniref:hypothetical protein n=1 Tax=Agrobacterium sp. V1 TaxID=3061957 RepID=UPI002672FAF1|nr:hypothetical protein [Agrobacterium sp. V1]MDO3441824.1 hypothetical protein [Agrobacterium sp. V1]